jgi:hypothetical protein
MPGRVQFACSTELLPRFNISRVRLSFDGSDAIRSGRVYNLSCASTMSVLVRWPSEPVP